MRRQDFSYELPEELIAQTPLAERSASRMLVLDGSTGAMADRTIRDLPSYLWPNDLLVFNDTRVVAARLIGQKPSGGRVEIFLERTLSGREALVQMRASKPIREGLEISTPGGVVRVLGREDDLWRIETPGRADKVAGKPETSAAEASEPLDQPEQSEMPEASEAPDAPDAPDAIADGGPGALEFFEAWGEVPLPPYIDRTPDSDDRERYQSIFARERGAVAAPTASLHFDDALVAAIDALGVRRTFVTLHVGAGTFQPIRTDDLETHVMHAERVTVSSACCEAIRQTRAAGGRVIAIGTTVVRALESAASAWQKQERAGEPTAQSSAADRPASRADASGPTAPTSGSRADASGPTAPIPGSRADASGPTAPTSGSGADASGPTAPTSGSRALASGATARDRASTLQPWSGDTRLFIKPGFRFQVVDALLTNFHLPESTLLMLVSAFAGREHVLNAYQHAVRERYRFFSYGDAMFITPAPAGSGAKDAKM